MVNVSAREVLDEEPLETILGVEEDETTALKMLLDVTIEPRIEERGGATHVVASHKSSNSEGGREQRHDSGDPCQGLPFQQCDWRETSHMLTTCMAMGWARSNTKYHIVHRLYNPGHHMIGTSIHTCSVRHSMKKHVSENSYTALHYLHFKMLVGTNNQSWGNIPGKIFHW